MNVASKPRIAIVTMGVKLGDETRGYTRFRKIAEVLVRAGFDVDLYTSSFQHWEKAARDTTKSCYMGLPYRIVFIDEPGYTRNLDLARIISHAIAAKNLRGLFDSEFALNESAYQLIYSEIPPNDVARVCAEVATEHGIPYVADINDLWPEAMRMVVDVPIVSDIAFKPFADDAHAVYNQLAAAVGTSDEYAARPGFDRIRPYKHITVYVGNDLAVFDAGAAEHADEVVKPSGEFWVTYTGTLGASYDIATLIRASCAANEQLARLTSELGRPLDLRVKILGDGPDREKLEALARELSAPVDFLGYTPYELMAAYLVNSDATINSLVKSAPQSIVTKIGDYLAAGIPLINTGSSPEFRAKVEADGFGINIDAEDADELAATMVALALSPAERDVMGARARMIAEEQFDQDSSYQAIVDLIRSLTA